MPTFEIKTFLKYPSMIKALSLSFKQTVIIFFFFFFVSCGDEQTSENIEPNETTSSTIETDKKNEDDVELSESEVNLKELLNLKSNSLTTSEKLRELAIRSEGNYKRLACFFKCSPSVLERLIDERTFPTKMAIEKIDEFYELIITNQNDLDYVNDCKEESWLNVVSGKPDYLKEEDGYELNLNDVWETTVTIEDTSFDAAEFSIRKLKELEVGYNTEFQNNLMSNSVLYFEDVLDDFFDSEYGINGALRELADNVNKTDEERIELWKARIKHYFSSIAYMDWVKTEVDTFASRVNRQRSEILEDEFNFSSTEKQKFKNHYLQLFKANDSLAISAQTRSSEHFKELAKDSAVEGSAFILTIIFPPAGARLDAYLIVEFVVDTGQEVFFPSEDETREMLTLAYNNFLQELEFNFSNDFNENADLYYRQMFDVIEKRKNETIKL